MDGKLHPFEEFKALAIFDPQVDHMYVNGLQFSNCIVPVLNTMFGDDIECTSSGCYFKQACSSIWAKYETMKLQFNLGPIDDFKKQTPITLDMAFYLVDGSYVGDSSDKCYIPIFVTNPGENVEAATHWFLGNMFMDRYFVANDW